MTTPTSGPHAANRWDAAVGRMIATFPLTIRIDLEPDPASS